MLNATEAPNRLIHETSPYLIQHAYNPVDWFPWCEEAFEKARLENKPVFLSIGYSTCHWCHVMARESFEDREIAEILNRNYISVKVDREERPDVDAVYLAVCQTLSGQGGWPMTILMTPEKQPFFAATYLPPRRVGGMYGLAEILVSAAERWKTHAAQFCESGEKLTAYLQNAFSVRPAESPDFSLLRRTAEGFQSLFDAVNGGFGMAPKFPSPHNLVFLMRYSKLAAQPEAMYMAEKTLTQMYRGGIFDHIGGGFCRYSTDERWFAPHFEKMLYDNALMTDAYLEAFQMTGNQLYREVALRTLRYMTNELQSSEGGFYSSQDADSGGVEGRYYLLEPVEIREWLGESVAATFCAWYGLSETGNFEGKNIPNLLDNPSYKREGPEMQKWRKIVEAHRRQRAPLHRDEKILTAWNSLAVSALARASVILEDDKYLEAARRTEQFIGEHLTVKGRLCVGLCEGKAGHGGYLEDYAFYCNALLSLYRVTFETDYLEKASRYAQCMLELFSDESGGGFYLYASDAEQLILRPKEIYDGAMPSGNAVAAEVLLALYGITDADTWRKASDRQIRFLTGASWEHPIEHGSFLVTLLKVFSPQRRLVCISPVANELPMLRKLAVRHPEMPILVLTPENAGLMARLAPYTADYNTSGPSRYQLCSDGKCSLPVSSLAELSL